VSPSRIRLIAALAFVLPATALVAAPAMAATKSHTHHTKTAHKTAHKKAKVAASH
jgi:hypothetical protein